MTDITADDEREAREWLRLTASYTGTTRHKHARTILALLDRPRMPAPVDVSDAVMVKIADAHRIPYADFRGMYRALYDHYTAPPAPRTHERWLVVCADGTEHGAWRTLERARDMAEHQPGSRIVRLVEADHDQ